MNEGLMGTGLIVAVILSGIGVVVCGTIVFFALPSSFRRLPEFDKKKFLIGFGVFALILGGAGVIWFIADYPRKPTYDELAALKEINTKVQAAIFRSEQIPETKIDLKKAAKSRRGKEIRQILLRYMDHRSKNEEKAVKVQNLQLAILENALKVLEAHKFARQRLEDGYNIQDTKWEIERLEVERKKLEAEYESLRNDLKPYYDEETLLTGILKSKFELLGSEVVK
jgi:hypothetical protein